MVVCERSRRAAGPEHRPAPRAGGWAARRRPAAGARVAGPPCALTVVLLATLLAALAACAPVDTGTTGQPYACDPPRPAAGTITLAGLAYGPYHDPADPTAAHLPSTQQIQADVRALRALTGRIRLYTAAAPAPAIVQAAEQAHLCVDLGIWLGRDPAANAAEVARAEVLAGNPAVRSLIVGSETLLRGDLSESQLTAYLMQVRAWLGRARLGHAVQVTTAEDFTRWLAHPGLAAAVDVLRVDIYPFWSQVPIAAAIAFFDATYRRLQAAFAGKTIVVGETGWPSDGPPQGAAVPGAENQARYLRDFVAWARQHEVQYAYFEAFDEGWKQNEAGVGTHWGLIQQDGVVKPALRHLLPPVPVPPAASPAPTLSAT